MTLIPLEQVIEIVFRLEEHVSVEVREGIWPDDLKIAVDELRGKTVVNDEKASSPSLITESAVDTGNIVDSGTTAEEAKENDSSGEPVTEPITSTPKPAPVSQPTPSPSIPLPITSTLSHPPQPTPFTQPLLPTSTPPPHTAVAPLPPPPAHYPYYGYPGYAYAPMQNPHQQPYGGYSSYPAPPLHIPPVPPHPQPHTHGKQPPTPLFTSAPLRSAIDPPKPLVAPIQHSHTPLHHTSPPLPLPHSVPPHPIPPHPIPPKSEDDDLPSYEDMLVQALIEINDPAGVQPRTMFSWMASRYPLQTNFRPSASQALQKAYKRGRFEKSEDGRYRLNIAWEGGSVCYISLSFSGILQLIYLVLLCRLRKGQLVDRKHLRNRQQTRIRHHIRQHRFLTPLGPMAKPHLQPLDNRMPILNSSSSPRNPPPKQSNSRLLGLKAKLRTHRRTRQQPRQHHSTQRRQRTKLGRQRKVFYKR